MNPHKQEEEDAALMRTVRCRTVAAALQPLAHDPHKEWFVGLLVESCEDFHVLVG